MNNLLWNPGRFLMEIHHPANSLYQPVMVKKEHVSLESLF